MYKDDQVRTKLDDKSKRIIFVGCKQKSKGYKVYNPNKKKIMINRDVEFNEKRAWYWKINDDEKYNFLPILDEEKDRYEIIKNL